MFELMLLILGAAALEKSQEGATAEDESLRLLGIGDPGNLSDFDSGWARFKGLIPWTSEQITSFNQGVLMCPNGHTSHFTINELEVAAAQVKTSTDGIVGADLQSFDRFESGGHRWLYCEVCTAEFWYPARWFDLQDI